jgi:hypothetical protein
MANLFQNFRKSGEQRRQEALNAYLDNGLTPGERQRFEQEVGRDPALRAELEQLRFVKNELRRMPRVRAPRNFVLEPAKYGRPVRPGPGRLYPALRLATVMTAFLFTLALVATFFTERAMTSPVVTEVQSEEGVAEVAAPEEVADETMALPSGVEEEEAELEPTEAAMAEMAEEAMEPAAGEVGIAEEPAESELAAATATFSGGAAAAPLPESTGALYATGEAAITDEYDGAGPRPTATPELAARMTAAPTATVAPPAEPAGADTLEQAEQTIATPVVGGAQGRTGGGLSGMAVLQIALGAALVVLLVATLIARRRLL